jgi:hypothetical protein
LIKIQIQSLGAALANSLMFFIHATAFGYGSVLVEQQKMNAIYVFRYIVFLKVENIDLFIGRVFSVITFGAMSVGR